MLFIGLFPASTNLQHENTSELNKKSGFALLFTYCHMNKNRALPADFIDFFQLAHPHTFSSSSVSRAGIAMQKNAV